MIIQNIKSIDANKYNSYLIALLGVQVNIQKVKKKIAKGEKAEPFYFSLKLLFFAIDKT